MIDQLTNARSAIMNVSKYGCGGKVKAKAKLGCFHLQPPTFYVYYFKHFIVSGCD